MNVRTGIKLCFALMVVSVALFGAFAKHLFKAWNAAEVRKWEAELREKRANVFGEPVYPTDDEAHEIAAALDRFRDANRNTDGPALAKLFDPERLYDELVLQSGPDLPVPANARSRSEFAAGFHKGAANFINNPLLDWDATIVRRIRWSANRDEAMVIASHRRELQILGEDTTISLRIRWWLVRQSGGWKIYDLEDLDCGVRISAIIATVVSPEYLPHIAKIRTVITAINEAQVAMLKPDVAAIDTALARCKGHKVPPQIAANIQLLKAVANMMRGDIDAAFKSLEEAERLNPDMPIRHSIQAVCHNLLGEHVEALAEADAYIAQLGPDAAIDVERGEAFEALERREEAAAAFRRALDDTPEDKEAFLGLLRVLPEGGDRSELADRLAKSKEPVKLFDTWKPLATEWQDWAAGMALEDGLHRAVPNDIRGITPAIYRLVDEKEFDAATAKMRDGLDRVKEDERSRVLSAYLYAMLGADRPLEAYSAVPDEHAIAAFRQLAEELEDVLLYPDEKSPEVNEKQLRELIATHKKRHPGDLWIGFYDAVMLQAAKEYEKAERAFAMAEAAYRKSAQPMEKDWEESTFRYRRVQCLYAAKKGLKAYAEIGPAKDTFSQLAYAYEADKDAAGLEALVAAHRKRSPRELQLLYWSAAVLRLKGKLGESADGYRAFLKKAEKMDANRWSAAQGCVRGYLQAERLRDATMAIADLEPELVPLALRVAVALADGRLTDAEALLAEAAEAPNGFGFLYYDEDFAKQIARPEYATLREQYPAPVPPKPLKPRD